MASQHNGAMQRCPKCEADLHDAALRCPLCGTTMRAAALQPQTRPGAILDPDLALFERDERLVHCPDCLREYREDVQRCRPCRLALVRCTRAHLQALLRRRPVAELAAVAAQAMPQLPLGMVRVAAFQTPFAAEAALRELAAFGVQGFIGHDGIDPATATDVAHVWVRQGDATTAHYLLGKVARGAAEDMAPRRREAAQSWLLHGKLRACLNTATVGTADPALAALAGIALLRLGRPQEAERTALAVPPCAVAAGEATRRATAGLYAALAALHPRSEATGPARSESAASARSEAREAALHHLRAAAALSPRRADIAQALVEVLSSSSDRAALRSALRTLSSTTPGVLGVGGFYADLAADLARGD